MNRAHATLLILGLVTVVALGHMAAVLPGLPDRIPTHFSGGQPDAWSDRDSFAWTWGATLAGTALVLAVTGWLIGRLDPRWVSMPHREVWLGPERQAATRRDLSYRIWGLGVLTMLLFLDLQVEMFAVAAGRAEDLTHFGVTMTIYLLATLAWTVALLVRYGRKPSGPPAA